MNLKCLTKSQNYWLHNVERLSQSLRENFSNWNIKLHYFGLMVATDEESLCLENTKKDKCYGRLISHNLGTETFILGKVIMTHETYIAFKDKLDSLSSRSIGDELLFIDPMYRLKFSVDILEKKSLSFLNLLKEKGLYALIPDRILVRNSLFVSKIDQNNKILVNEYFLKDIY